MASLKALAKDTAIYGMSSIVGRFLNYMLVPLYTRVLNPGEYGIVTNLYGYVALILVVLTFGMETTFFRFANKEGERPDTVFTTAFAFVSLLTVLFLCAVFGFVAPLADAIGYAAHPDYLLMMAVVVSIDVIQAIPFCYLRFCRRPIKFALLKMLFIVLNMGLNLLCFLVLGIRDVAFVFILNLICSAFVTVFFIPEFVRMQWAFDGRLLRRMLSYTWPLLVLGMAGILNQTADKIIFPLVYPDEAEGRALLGVYGGCVKIAMIMAMITQAFRYAYEPLVFAESRSKDSSETYAMGMKFFLVFTLLAFLCVMGYMDILQRILGPDYREGMRVVPIVMAAEIMMGIYFNLSFWYKLIDRTIYGAWFSLAGCAVLIAVNLLFIPRYSYMACAWGGVAGYGTSMLLSYFVGQQRKNPIPYPLRSMAAYVLLAAAVYGAMYCVPAAWPLWLRLSINTLLIGIFAAYIWWADLSAMVQRRKR